MTVSPLVQLDLLVVVHGDSGQGAHRLPLAAGGDDADLLRRQMRELLQGHEGVIGDRQVAEITGNLDVLDH